MAFIKKNTVSSIVVVASSVYSCTKCDHTEIVKDADIDEDKKCPHCEAEMKIISTSVGDEEKEEEETEKE
jgi:predicted nucleic acid-binding Zn ribbon protein